MEICDAWCYFVIAKCAERASGLSIHLCAASVITNKSSLIALSIKIFIVITLYDSIVSYRHDFVIIVRVFL